ncbi:MAG: hypothetical protein HYS13_20020 [Planctomycetia bacterium]|nr:hypothetical protein [Planctomycetia bacterium]
MFRTMNAIGALGLLAVVAGCGDSQTATPSGPSAEGAKFIAAAEPAGAKDVIATRETAGDGDDLVVVGRIGGSPNPWVEGFAQFSIVDRSLKACSEREGDSCPTPWDFCCDQSILAKSMVEVKIVDETGQTVAAGAKDFLGVKELDTIVVKGKAKKDDKGNVSILASQIYVKR